MKLFDRNAGLLLFEKVKSISQAHDNWRCLYINFSNERDEYSEGLRTHVITTIIRELLEGDDGYIYLCEDGDVFILAQKEILPILDKFGENFKGLAKCKGQINPSRELYTLFDCRAHWNEFFALCKAKATATPINGNKVAIELQTTPPHNSLRNPDVDVFNKAIMARAQRKRPLVLLVEDDPFTRRLVNNAIKADYDVVEAANGDEAIDAYENLAPDAVFLDIGLPDVNGQVILKKLIALDAGAFIVMLSANSGKENILAALETGAQGFVIKPFSKEKLMHYLHLSETIRQVHTTHTENFHAPRA